MVFYLFLKSTPQSMCYLCFINEEIEILWFQKLSLGYVVNTIQIWKQICLVLNIHDIVSTMYIFSMYIVHISVVLLCKMVMADSKVKLCSIHSFWIHWILFSVTFKSIPRLVSAPLATFLSPHFFLTMDHMLVFKCSCSSRFLNYWTQLPLPGRPFPVFRNIYLSFEHHLKYHILLEAIPDSSWQLHKILWTC